METRSMTAAKKRRMEKQADSVGSHQFLESRTNKVEQQRLGSTEDAEASFPRRITRQMTFAALKKARELEGSEGGSSTGNSSEMNDDSRLNYEIHPLNNPVILQSVFQFCSVKLLKACRLVSSMWLKESLNSWREKAVVRMVMHSGSKNPFSEYISVPNLIKSSKLEKKHRLKSRPFSNYKLYGKACLCYGCHGDLPEWFFNNFNSSIKYLEISDFDMSFRHILRLISMCTAMNHLKLSDCLLVAIEDGEDESSYDVIPHEYPRILRFEFFNNIVARGDWIELLRRMPNLEMITLEDLESRYHTIYGNYLESMMEAVKEMKLPTLLVNLKELNVGGIDSKYEIPNFSLERAQLIKKCQFQLTRISISIDENANPSAVKITLEAHAQTLTYFRAVILPNDDYMNQWQTKGKFRPMWKIPLRMEKLAELRFVNRPYWGFNLLRSLDAPQLQKLVFENDENEGRPSHKKFDFHHDKLPKILLKKIVLPEVEHFHYEPYGGCFSSMNLEALARSMPNLKHLTISLTSETFPVACRYWTGLKTLKVFKGCGESEQLKDEAITGTSRKRKMVRPANISDLRELTDLEIEQDKPSLTDFSVRHGFLLMPRLHYLKVPFNKLSDSAKSALEEHVHFVEYSN